MNRFTLPFLVLALTLAPACGGSDSEETKNASLPTTFGDCGGAATCEVSLVAFGKDSKAIPYCPATRDEAASCTGPLATAGGTFTSGQCGALEVFRDTYGFPGDFYQCHYDATGALVGAIWAPDSHPKQIAGEQVPAECQPTQLPCAGPN